MDQKTNAGCLVNGSKFAFMAFRSDITEYPVAFDENLSYIRN